MKGLCRQTPRPPRGAKAKRRLSFGQRQVLSLRNRRHCALWRATPGEGVRGYTITVACGGSPIDAAMRFILICVYTGKEVV